jgi:hypothetical protein
MVIHRYTIMTEIWEAYYLEKVNCDATILSPTSLYVLKYEICNTRLAQCKHRIHGSAGVRNLKNNAIWQLRIKWTTNIYIYYNMNQKNNNQLVTVLCWNTVIYMCIIQTQEWQCPLDLIVIHSKEYRKVPNSL